MFGPSGLVALPLMTSGSGIYAGMAVYAGGLAVSYLCGFVLTGCSAVKCRFKLERDYRLMPGGGFALPGLQNSYAAAPDYHFLPRRPGARML